MIGDAYDAPFPHCTLSCGPTVCACDARALEARVKHDRLAQALGFRQRRGVGFEPTVGLHLLLSSGSKCEGTQHRILARWCNVSGLSVRLRARDRIEHIHATRSGSNQLSLRSFDRAAEANIRLSGQCSTKPGRNNLPEAERIYKLKPTKLWCNCSCHQPKHSVMVLVSLT
jgi:hypothetical protein